MTRPKEVTPVPRKLDVFPAPPQAQSRYPWSEFFDGGVWQLIQGEDYDSKTKTFVVNARAQAKRRGGTLKTRLIEQDGRESVVMQFSEAR
jgi:hypothetical protein